MSRGLRFLPLLLVALGFLAYANTFNVPFYFDDIRNISENRYIQISDLSVASLRGAWHDSPIPRRGVVNISFALNYYFHQYAMTGYHAVNIVIHVINGILVYYLALMTFSQVSRLSKGEESESGDPSIPWKSLLAASVFMVHPLQTQAVTYIVQRMTSMSVMFYLLAMLLYICGLRHGHRAWRWSLWAGCLASWFLALGSKEIAATLPLMLLLYRWYFFEDLRVEWLRRNAVYLLGLLILLVSLSLFYLGGGPWDEIMKGYAHREFTLGERLLTQFRVVFSYIGQLLFPHPSRLNLIHHISTSRSLVEPISTLVAVLGIIALVGGAIHFRKQHRVLSFGVLWILGTLVIESSVVPLEMMFEHRLYLPMFGFVLMVSQLLLGSWPDRRWWSAGTAALVIAVLTVATVQRNEVWRDPVTLWSDVIAKNPQSNRAYNNLGRHYLAREELSQAAGYFRQSLRVKHEYSPAHVNLGLVLRMQGRLSEAADHYRHALRINPDNAKAHIKLGDLLRQQGKRDEARASYQSAVRIDPTDAWSHFGLGLLAEPRPAIEHFRAAVRHDPNHASAANNLAWLLATSSEPQRSDAEEAVRWAQQAVAATGEEATPEVLDTLAVAYAAAGRFERAIEAANKAIDLCVRSGDLDTAKTIRQRLRLYENGQPFREPSL